LGLRSLELSGGLESVFVPFPDAKDDKAEVETETSEYFVNPVVVEFAVVD